MKKIICLFLFSLLALPFFAQDSYISNVRCSEEDCIESLQGNCGVLLLSKSNDLVISSDNVMSGLSVDFKGMRPDGFYKYVVTIPAGSTKNPNLQVSRRSSVYNTSLTATVSPDYLVAYRIEVVAKPVRLVNTTNADEQNDAYFKTNEVIDLVDATKQNDVHFNGAEAALELSTTLDSMKVTCSPYLRAKITQKVSKADKKVKITTIVFPLASIKEAKEKHKSLNEEYTKLLSEVESLENPEDASAEVWNRLDTLEAEVDKWNQISTGIGNVFIKVPGSNDLQTDVSDFTPRKKVSVVIVPLLKKLFVTECSSLMSQAANLFNMRKYKEARDTYQKALHSKDIVSDMKPNILKCISLCDSCFVYDHHASAALKKMKDLKKDRNATQDQVARYASAASTYLQVLYNYNPDAYYKKFIDKMEVIVAKMPLLIKFTAVEWKTLEEGNKIPNVEFWAYYGELPEVYPSLKSESKFKRFLSKRPELFKQIGTTNANGLLEVSLDRCNLPNGIICFPMGRRDIKAQHLSIDVLFRQAKGTYFEKQFRLKMFTKID